jgi:hypothetical protein
VPGLDVRPGGLPVLEIPAGLVSCPLCAFPDWHACVLLRRHERIEYAALLIVLDEQARAREQQL